MRPILIAFATLVLGLAFAGQLKLNSSAQQQRIPSSRHPACGCYVCGKLLAVEFPDKDPNCSGILSTDACTQQLSAMPAEKRIAFCKKVKSDRNFTSFKNSCPDFAAVCEPQGEDTPKEQPATKCKERGPYDVPWFDPSAEGCQDLQDTRMNANWTSANGGTCKITLTACNYTALTFVVNLVKEQNGKLEPTGVTSPFTLQQLSAMGIRPIRQAECQSQLYDASAGTHPNKVCCDIWREGVRAGSGCNPEIDADCDELPNDRDNYLNSRPYYAPPVPRTWEQDLFHGNTSDFNSANFDPRPPGLSWDEVMPNEPCKRCKWVARSGKLTCSPDGRKQHEYKVSWECPSSGVQRVVVKRAPASAPCTPPRD